ncbi:MAG: hypothetical protein K2L89_03160, partial [Muribaculaceae bacterium]|nr:hypothetical protein [Muribaculaceae bacterium]
VPLAGFSANITIDFRNFKPANDKEFLSNDEVFSFLAEENDPDVVSGVNECNLVYGKKSGVPADNSGALFIQATDPVSKEDIGCVSFTIAPQYRHRNTNVNIYAYPLSVTGTDPKLEVSINGGEFQTVGITKMASGPSRAQVPANKEIVRDLKIKVPNVARKDNGSLAEGDMDYYVALSYINLYYSDETSEEVTVWNFDTTSHTAYMNEADSYEPPVLNTIPQEAAEFAEYESSDPDVAIAKNGKVTICGVGTTVITANLPENSLFHPSDSYQPASYELTVKPSSATSIECIEIEREESYSLYNLCGQPVNENPVPGIYIRKTSAGSEKVVVR